MRKQQHPSENQGHQYRSADGKGNNPWQILASTHVYYKATPSGRSTADGKKKSPLPVQSLLSGDAPASPVRPSGEEDQPTWSNHGPSASTRTRRRFDTGLPRRRRRDARRLSRTGPFLGRVRRYRLGADLVRGVPQRASPIDNTRNYPRFKSENSQGCQSYILNLVLLPVVDTNFHILNSTF